MMKTVKVSKLTGAALDWAVAVCRTQDTYFDLKTKAMVKEFPCFNPQTKRVYVSLGMMEAGYDFRPSSNWAQGGPIIERNNIATFPNLQGEWAAYAPNSTRTVSRTQTVEEVFVWAFKQTGPTPLIAAMRCYVASKLGDTIEVPEELL